MKEVDFTHRANTDLREIWQFTARRWDIDQADSYIGQILETCTSLANGLSGGSRQSSGSCTSSRLLVLLLGSSANCQQIVGVYGGHVEEK